MTDQFDRWRAIWTSIAAEPPNLFSTWEWCSTWWRHFGRGHELHIEIAYDGSEPVALVPLYRTSGRTRLLRFVGDGVGDQCGPVCQAVDRDRAGRLLRAMLQDIPHDVFLAERLRTAEQWPTRIGGAIAVDREKSPFASLRTKDWTEYLAGRSKNFRRSAQRVPDRLHSAHRVEIHRTQSPKTLHRDLATMFDLHLARWGIQSTGVLAPSIRHFHQDFAGLALDRGWLRLWILSLDGTPAAAWYGFRYGGVEWFYQQGRQPALDGVSAGTYLILHTLRAAVEDGIATYTFLRGNEPYKYRFADSADDLETLVVRTREAG